MSTAATKPITPDQLVPLNLGLVAIRLACERLERKPHQQRDCLDSIRETVDKLHKYVERLQGAPW